LLNSSELITNKLHRRGVYGQDVYSLKGLYLEGQKAPTIHMHWRRFAITEIPIKDDAAFDAWLMKRWREKDDYLAYFEEHSRFPTEEDDATETKTNGSASLETKTMHNNAVTAKVSTAHPLDFLQIFVSLLAVPVAWKLAQWTWWVTKVVLLVASLGTIKL
jgi:lysocardiolipin and lysophospholipid acyltransferase